MSSRQPSWRQPRPRLAGQAGRRYSSAEIVEVVPQARQQLEQFAADGVPRAQWYALIGRRPAIERADDITELVIAILEARWSALPPVKPPARSRKPAAAADRVKERA
jgi:hypothetical protein